MIKFILWCISAVVIPMILALFTYWMGGGEFVRCPAMGSAILFSFTFSVPFLVFVIIAYSEDLL